MPSFRCHLRGLILAVALAVSGASAGVSADAIMGRKPNATWEGVHIYRNFSYGPRLDAPGEGEGYKSPMTGRHPEGWPFHSHRSGQFFDLIIAQEREIDPKMPVFVNLHGGAWCQPFDKDGEDLHYLAQLARKGFLVVNMDYQLQSDILTWQTQVVKRENATWVDMLRDIDAMAAFLKKDFLPKLGILPTKFALGGGSAGAHLSLLYAFDQDNALILNAGLRHEYRVGFVVDIVGPADLSSDDFLGPFLTKKYPWGSIFNEWSGDRCATLLGWLANDDVRARIAKGDLIGAREVLRKSSPLYYVTPRSVPCILAYCQIYPFSSTDGCVPTSSYYDLKRALELAGVPHVGDIRTFRLHGWLRRGYLNWVVDHSVEFADRFLR